MHFHFHTRAATSRRRFISAAAATLAAPRVFAQSDKTVKFILPVSAGSGVDGITRAASNAISKALGQTVVIENQPGAGGVVGTSNMIKSAPDGLTVSMVSNNHVIYPSVLKSVPFDPVNDITPIAVVGATPLVLVVNPSKVSAKNMKELVALFKANPGKFNYASSGNGKYLVEGWIAVIGPKGIPVDMVKRINAAFVTAYATPEVKEAMAKQGNTINISTPEFAAVHFKSELAKYAALVKKAGVVPS